MGGPLGAPELELTEFRYANGPADNTLLILVTLSLIVILASAAVLIVRRRKKPQGELKGDAVVVFIRAQVERAIRGAP